MFIICDLDGTLALIEHRRHLIEGRNKKWDLFFKACPDDKPNWPIIHSVRSLMASGDHRIEIWSGRSDEVRAETETWLRQHGLGGLPLRMRPAGCYTPDNQLKEEWLLSEDQKPDLVFDDRDKVVAMWRSHGIVCAQVAPGNF
ncbi:MAG: phosphatase domain-containing protein [Parvularcula sp.]